MIQKIKAYLLTATSLVMLAVPVVATTAVASAADGCSGITNSLATGANSAIPGSGDAVNCASTGVNNDSVKTLAAKITNTFSIIVGAASVIMIIYGGFRYVTSGGESGRVGAAKNALLYAIVGLAIVALAQLIVHFVLAQSTNITGNGSATGT